MRGGGLAIAPRKRTLSDVAREAMDGSENYRDAAERVLEMLTPEERAKLLEPYEMSAALALVRSTSAAFRKSVWTPPAQQPNRIAALARANRASLLDFPLPGGLPLRDARRADVDEAVAFYAEHSADMAHKARWLGLVRKALKQDQRVADALSAADLEKMQMRTKE